MPKHDAFTPKAIANKQKSVGLQRLRWYCQLCEKQCRDENGFKCHTMSEGHLRMMRVFAENPNHILDEFSRDFEKTFLQILSHRHGTKRVAANRVYQEMIADKQHIHMNATTWTTLTGFCIYLGKEGKAIVDETEKGWFVQYIERDPKVLERQAQAEARRQQELDEEERHKRNIEMQIKAAQDRELQREQQRAIAEAEAGSTGVVDAPGTNDDVNGSSGEAAAPKTLSLSKSVPLNKKRPKAVAFGDDDEDEGGNADGTNELEAARAAKLAKSHIGKIMQQEQSRRNFL